MNDIVRLLLWVQILSYSVGYDFVQKFDFTIP